TFSADCAGNIEPGQTKTCTVTNDDQVIVVSVTTTLSGGEQIGPSIHVPPGTPVVDQAALSGVTPTAGGTITYKVYSDSACTALVFDATPTPNTVINGTAPASNVFSSSTVGVFFWQAIYSGDANNAGAPSVCADERLVVAAFDAALLIVKKHVLNDSGGSDAIKVASNFFLQILTPNGGAITPQFAGSESGTLFALPRAGAYPYITHFRSVSSWPPIYSADANGAGPPSDVKAYPLAIADFPPA